MSLSNILLSNNPVAPQSWTNLTCNSIKSNSITLINPVTVSFPNPAVNLNIALANNSATAGINYTLTTNPYPAIFSSAVQAIQINDTGKYYIKVNMPQVNMQNIADSYGNITAVLKYQLAGSGGYVDLDTQTQNIPNDTTAVSYNLAAVRDIVPGTLVQVLFIRSGASIADGVIILADSGTSNISFLKIT